METIYEYEYIPYIIIDVADVTYFYDKRYVYKVGYMYVVYVIEENKTFIPERYIQIRVFPVRFFVGSIRCFHDRVLDNTSVHTM